MKKFIFVFYRKTALHDTYSLTIIFNDINYTLTNNPVLYITSHLKKCCSQKSGLLCRVKIHYFSDFDKKRVNYFSDFDKKQANYFSDFDKVCYLKSDNQYVNNDCYIELSYDD